MQRGTRGANEYVLLEQEREAGRCRKLGGGVALGIRGGLLFAVLALATYRGRLAFLSA